MRCTVISTAMAYLRWRWDGWRSIPWPRRTPWWLRSSTTTKRRVHNPGRSKPSLWLTSSDAGRRLSHAFRRDHRRLSAAGSRRDARLPARLHWPVFRPQRSRSLTPARSSWIGCRPAAGWCSTQVTEPSDLWAGERILTTADVPGLTNGVRLPVEMVFNCLDGYFIHPQPSRQGLAETLQRQPGGGAVAAISPSGLGLTSDQQNFRKILMTVLFKDGVRDLGTALTKTKRQFYATYGPNYLIGTMTLFGDPAMQLPQAATSAVTYSSVVHPAVATLLIRVCVSCGHRWKPNHKGNRCL